MSSFFNNLWLEYAIILIEIIMLVKFFSPLNNRHSATRPSALEKPLSFSPLFRFPQITDDIQIKKTSTNVH